MVEELRERLAERLGECENLEIFLHRENVYIRYVYYGTYKFLKVIDLEGLLFSLPIQSLGKVYRLTKESLKCLQEIPSNTRTY
ncbi:hypothetical protein CrV_gp093 [Cylindrospermopsis raciborskii virus RM-2018a]|jgi:hypothetical protein|nr:hypothetical protein CrV_gp093 [Cylindrospermopsis raciborskii virus RM-2018a]WHL30665.1 hypothetical protein CrLKS4_g99 [Cylindrospermopsis phage Cr-LKS4]